MPRFYRIKTTGMTGDMTAMTRGWTWCLEWGAFSFEVAVLRRESG